MDARPGDTGAEALDALVEMYPHSGEREEKDVRNEFVKEYVGGLYAKETEPPATEVALTSWLAQVH